jgi:hypothetical protein
MQQQYDFVKTSFYRNIAILYVKRLVSDEFLNETKWQFNSFKSFVLYKFDFSVIDLDLVKTA